MTTTDNKLIWENFMNKQNIPESKNHKDKCLIELENMKKSIEEIDTLDSRELEYICKEISNFSNKLRKFIDTDLRPDVEFLRQTP